MEFRGGDPGGGGAAGKGKEQWYFHGVFPEASAKRTFADVESDSSGDDICVMQKSKVKKF